MGKHAEIRDSLKAFAGQFGPLQTMLATVQDVSEAESTCTLVDDEGLEYYDVQLRCVLTANESETFYPAPGAYALAARVEDSETWVLLGCEKMTKKRTVVNTAVLETTANGHLMQKGSDTLKQVLTLLIQAVQQIVVLNGNNPDYVKLAQALTKVNNLLQ